MFLRRALIDSHVAAITVALLMLMSGADFVLALREPASSIGAFLGTAALTLDIPYIPRTLDPFTRVKVIASALELAEALLVFGAAWILSQWTYSVGPIRCLRSYRNIVRRTSDVRSFEDSSR